MLGCRNDGFHEIRSVLARVELHDTLTIRPAAELGVRWPAGMLAPADDLIRRAALLFREATGCQLGARITVEKSIPMAGGLGGGSSDAASTLFALNELWSTGLSCADLAAVGSSLGSDIPFFFHPSPALARGRGETVEPIRAQPRHWVVLAAPDWPVQSKTATLFDALTPDDFSDGEHISHIVEAMQRNWLGLELGNTFERVIDHVFPRWTATRQQLERESGVRFWLTGAGPCLYALLPAEIDATRVVERIRPLGMSVLLTRLVDGDLRVAQ